MKKSTLRRADLIFSIILILISVMTLIESYSLLFNPFGRKNYVPTAEEKAAAIKTWYESPALFPAIIALFLLLCAVFLLRVAIKDGAKIDFFTNEKIKMFFTLRETHVAVIVIGILCVYVFLLIPFCRKYLDLFPKFQGFPFMIATFISLVAQMIVFNEKSTKKILISILVAMLSAIAITYGFGTLAMIPLP